MYIVKAIRPFTDMENKCERTEGEIFTVGSQERITKLLGDKFNKPFVRIIKMNKRQGNIYNGPKIIIYQDFLYKIGGIETFLMNFTKAYIDRNITIIVRDCDISRALEISEYADVIIDEPGATYECDTLILGNHNAQYALDKIKFKTAYQMIHADFHALTTKYAQWQGFKWIPDKRISKVISVSETARIGLKKAFGIDSEVIYNILDIRPQRKTLKLITLSRATEEKGIGRIVLMAKALKEANIPFLWFLCTPPEQIQPSYVGQINAIPEILLIKPQTENKGLISACDYLVQLSDTESFCYSAFEALQLGKPVILTDFPEAKNIIKEGKNGYLLRMDMQNLDVEKIANNIPTEITFEDKCNKEDWERVFRGEL